MIKSYKFRRHLSNFIIYLILGVMCIIWIMPFVYLVLHSLRLDGGVIDNGALLPKQLTFQHYIDLFAGNAPSGAGKATLYFPQWFTNTFIVACFSCVISTLSVLAVSYTFSRLRFGVRKTLMNIAMILGMFPGFMTMIAMYYLLKIMHLDGTLFALVLCYSCGAGLGFQISKGFFDTIPRALDEAATIDGASPFKTFTKITLPYMIFVTTPQLITAFVGKLGRGCDPDHPALPEDAEVLCWRRHRRRRKGIILFCAQFHKLNRGRQSVAAALRG